MNTISDFRKTIHALAFIFGSIFFLSSCARIHYVKRRPDKPFWEIVKPLMASVRPANTALLTVSDTRYMVDGGKIIKRREADLNTGRPNPLIFIPIILYTIRDNKIVRRKRRLHTIEKTMARINIAALAGKAVGQQFLRTVIQPISSGFSGFDAGRGRKKSGDEISIAVREQLKKAGFSRVLFTRVTEFYLRQYCKRGDFHAEVSLLISLFDIKKNKILWKIRVWHHSRIKGYSLSSITKRGTNFLKHHFRKAFSEAASMAVNAFKPGLRSRPSGRDASY